KMRSDVDGRKIGTSDVKASRAHDPVHGGKCWTDNRCIATERIERSRDFHACMTSECGIDLLEEQPTRDCWKPSRRRGNLTSGSRGIEIPAFGAYCDDARPLKPSAILDRHGGTVSAPSEEDSGITRTRQIVRDEKTLDVDETSL